MRAVREWGRRIWLGLLGWPVERRVVVGVCLALAVLGIEFLMDTADSWRPRLAERLAEGKPPTSKHHFLTGLWYGTLCSVIALTAAAATAKWWLERPPRRTSPASAPSPPGIRFWILVSLAVAVAFAVRWPRMDESVYVDEEYTLRSNAHGEFAENADGRPEFQPIPWGHRLWENKIGNNHFLYSVAGRLSLDVWRALTGAPREGFDETAFRLPSLLAGLASVAALAVLGARLGFPHAGWIAAWLLALHPWHLRYSAEGRGYALMILCLLGALLCLVRALRRGDWPGWIGFGLLQFLMMGFYGGALYVGVAMNLAVLGHFGVRVIRRGFGAETRVPVMRWVVANALTAVLLMQTMLPWMLEIRRYLTENPRAFGGMGADWYRDVASYLATGMQWASDAPGNPIIITSSGQLGGWAVPVLALIGALVAAGFLRMFLRDSAARVVAATFLLAGPLAIGHSILGGRLLFTWYLLYLVPGVVLAIALAVDRAASRLPFPRGLASVALGGAAVLVWAALVSTQLATVSLNPKEDFREVVRIMRGDVDVTGRVPPAAITAFSFSEGGFYDPWARTIWDAGDVRDLMRRADAEDRPLVISYGHREISLERRAEIMRLLDDPRLFRVIAVVPGLEEAQFTHYVLLHVPGRTGR